MKRLLTILVLSSAIFTKSVADEVFSVPFEDRFDANTKRELYTTIDANNDGVTIKKHYTQSVLPGFFPDTDHHEMEYDSGSAQQNANDWFITPKIHLEPGKIYSFAFDARVSFDSFTQRVGVYLGKDDKVEAMDVNIISPTIVSSSDNRKFTGEVSVEEEGDYRFGFHVTSEPDHGSLYFTNIAIKLASTASVPAQVSDLNIAADPTGLLSATISFTAPSVNVDGTTLEAITKVEILRGSAVITTLNDVQPGQNVTYEDKTPRNGLNTYAVVVYNKNGKGLRKEVKDIYIGVDTPLAPLGFRLTDKINAIGLSWDGVAEKGVNGSVVRDDGITYYVEEVDGNYYPVREISRSTKKSTDYTFNTLKGGQELKRFGVRAYNDAGWSEYSFARMVVGAPYNMPFHESFATGVSHGLTWQEGMGNVEVITTDSSDDDAGCATFTARYDNEAVSMNFGKISMQNTMHPVLSFRYKGKGVISISATGLNNLKKDFSVIESQDENWTMVSIDLSEVNGETYIIPKFMMKGTAGETICIDDINIIDLYDFDLDIIINEAKADVNHAFVSMTITNKGMEEAENYSINAFVNNEEVLVSSVDETLPSGMSKDMTIDIPLNGQYTDEIEVKIVVSNIYDVYPDNNIATVQVCVNKEPLSDGDTDGISSISTYAKQTIYTLDGRIIKPENMGKGIYITGNRKFVRK